MSHLVGKLATGNYLVSVELDKTVTNGSTKIDDQQIQELTPSNTVAWSWKLFDHIPPSGSREELCHANTLRVDEAAGFVYYNCRYLGLFKIDRASGDIIWRLGGSYDKTSLGAGDFTYAPEAARFSDAHDPELNDDSTVLLYDNGGFAGVGGTTTNYHSRVLEYQIDQTAKTVKVSWEFPGSFAVDAWYKNSWYSPYWGDADRLAERQHPDHGRHQGGQRLLAHPGGHARGQGGLGDHPAGQQRHYQAERLSPPPLVETLPSDGGETPPVSACR